MKHRNVLLVGAFALALAACAPKTTEAAAPETPAKEAASMADMKMDAPPADAVTAKIMGEGTIAAVDAAGGTIKLDHGPIAALNWPAMSMAFTVTDAKTLEGLKVGDAVSFEIKSQTESSAITALRKK